MLVFTTEISGGNTKKILLYDSEINYHQLNLKKEDIAKYSHKIKSKLSTYLNEEFGNHSDCGSVFRIDDVKNGHFTSAKTMQQIIDFTACDFSPNTGNLNGFAIFEKGQLISVIESPFYMVRVVDFNNDGISEIISIDIDSFHGVYSTQVYIIDLSNGRYNILYTDRGDGLGEFSFDADGHCYPGKKYSRIDSKLYVKLEKSPIFIRERYEIPTKNCKEDRKNIKRLSTYITKGYEINNRFNKPINTQTRKIQYHNDFKPFYSIQLAVYTNHLHAKNMEKLSKKIGYELISFFQEREESISGLINDFGLKHMLIGRFKSKKSALTVLSKLRIKFPNQLLFQQPVPQIRYFNGETWLIPE